jgi:hypothetical protein
MKATSKIRLMLSFALIACKEDKDGHREAMSIWISRAAREDASLDSFFLPILTCNGILPK